MWCLNNFIKSLIIVLCLLVGGSESSCNLYIPVENKPLLTQTFGSKVILIDNFSNLVLDDGDELQIYCSSGFKTFNTYKTRQGYRNHYTNNLSSERSLNFKCVLDKVHINEPNVYHWPEENFNVEEHIELNGETLPSCKGKVYAMYESRHKLPNCDDNLSYALGAKLTMPIITAALCYDLENLSLKYVSYKPHEQTSILEKAKHFYPEGLMANSLAEPLKTIGHLFKFPTDMDISNGFELQAESNFWLQIASYDLDNIIQTSLYKSQLEEFKDYFNTIWWRNLRIGNWRRFMLLLDARSDNVTYNIYTGTSGKLRVPFEKYKCETEGSKELHLTTVNTRVPQFIWTYLKSTSGDVAEDFVVIAYNSPYFEYFDRNSTVICNDMCDEVDWLQPMQDSRSISVLGYFYCCHSDEVIGVLEGFPLVATNKTIINTEIPENI